MAIWILAPLFLLAAAAWWAYPRLPMWRTYFKFGIVTVTSPLDADGDGVDDYTDFMRGARAYILTSPIYNGEYCDGGYPPEGQGVCTDVIWRGLFQAGYDFKAMIDADIAAHPGEYPLPEGKIDTNIDFRRVVNLQVYFERNAISLTIDPDQIDQWQPGDIVFYDHHVAVVSDKRNASGQPFIIHHAGYGPLEEDALSSRPIIGHYRLSAEG